MSEYQYSAESVGKARRPSGCAILALFVVIVPLSTCSGPLVASAFRDPPQIGGWKEGQAHRVVGDIAAAGAEALVDTTMALVGGGLVGFALAIVISFALLVRADRR